jgi:hypothetical protein
MCSIEKKCSKCSVVKPLSEFHKNKATKDGHSSNCKDCRKKQQDAYYAIPENREAQYARNNSRKQKPGVKCLLSISNKEYHKLWYAVPENREKKCNQGKQPEVLTRQKIYRMEQRIKVINERLSKGAKPGDVILYVLKFRNKNTQDTFYKIGVTELSVKLRYSGYVDYHYEVISESYFEKTYCYTLEQKLIYEHNNLGLQYVFPSNESFVGYTECFIELDRDLLLYYLYL